MPKRRPHSLSLGRLVAALLLGAAALTIGAFIVLAEASQAAVLAGAQAVALATGQERARQISAHLDIAPHAISGFERRLTADLIELSDPTRLEAAVVGGLLEHQDLTEMTVTFASTTGGDLSWQLSARRSSPTTVLVQITRQSAKGWITTRRAPNAADEEAGASDPTQHPTFSTPSAPQHFGQLLWSDLAFAEPRPAGEPEVVVTVQKAIRHRGRVLVIRAGVHAAALDEVIARAGHDDRVKAGHIFVSDRHGRLITRMRPNDRHVLLDEAGRPDRDGDVRVSDREVPSEVVAALARARQTKVKAGESRTTRIAAGGGAYLTTLTALPAGFTQDWMVGVVFPESAFLDDVRARQRRAMAVVSLALALMIALAWLAFRAFRKGFDRVVADASKMCTLDFSPDPRPAHFREVQGAHDALERAKTALRAMGRYVPVDLVRELFADNRDPRLGARRIDLTIMFTDVQDFTTTAEAMPPERLAEALGLYLSTVATAIASTGGLVDKYMGDGVMALWNVPRTLAEHPRAACEAVLRAQVAERALFDSSAWAGLPAWVTRFGLHRDTAMVGHFGAPDRFSYTAMGDGVNLAARLEGANKLYGTTTLVSETVRDAAREGFVWRRIDRIAVKGKSKGVTVYELMGRVGEVDEEAMQKVARYEAALDAYLEGRFEAARRAFAALGSDAPSSALAARCETLLANPPAPESWSGVYRALQK
ncbi:MAG: adenylate/guanylate cyclase domain-containing protein [Deltaproteobacteria bacterium]|nr:adenylate/guanylate cyclase domain-containing protein [Deltaproteobacteria bacterium]